tara:strand:+ start:414 stop:1379 length:966 start_codon:yes stop_codon:yes gene_type:complete
MSTDDTNYFNVNKYGRDKGVINDAMTDATDAYANFHQMILSFLHVGSRNSVFFKAFVTELSNNFSCEWQPSNVYGRTDPIQTYGGTTRSLSLAFDVPASTVTEAYENLGRVSKLAQMLYPNYTQGNENGAKIISKAPLVRVKLMNLITKERDSFDNIDDMQRITGTNGSTELIQQKLFDNYQTSPNPENGLLCAIKSMSYNSDLQNIQVFEKAPNTVLPQSIKVSLSLDVIHEETLGFDEGGNFMAPSFPHKVTLSDPASNRVPTDQNFKDILTRIDQDERNQAKDDERIAAQNRLLRKMGRNAANNRLNNYVGDIFKEKK